MDNKTVNIFKTNKGLILTQNDIEIYLQEDENPISAVLRVLEKLEFRILIKTLESLKQNG